MTKFRLHGVLLDSDPAALNAVKRANALMEHLDRRHMWSWNGGDFDPFSRRRERALRLIRHWARMPQIACASSEIERYHCSSHWWQKEQEYAGIPNALAEKIATYVAKRRAELLVAEAQEKEEP